MLRKEYQKRFFGSELDNKSYGIQDIESEFSLVSELFTELNNEICKNNKHIDLIEDYINTTKNEVDEEGEKLLIESNKLEFELLKNKLVGGVIGAGLGSIVCIYSPYIAIVTIVSGGITGWLLGSK